MLPLDPLEEFYGRGEAAIRPGDAVGAYGPPPFNPEESLLFPTELASNLDTPVWGRRFANAIRFKTGRVLNRLATVLVPSIPLAPFNPEDLWPDELLIAGSIAAVQTVANTSVCICFNPAGSGLRIIIEEWWASRMQTAGTINVWEFIFPPGPLGAVWANNPHRFRDSRRGFNNQLDINAQLNLFSNVSSVFPGGGINTQQVVSGVITPPAISRQPVILDPGSGFGWSPSLVNEGIQISLWLRARLIDVSPNKVP